MGLSSIGGGGLSALAGEARSKVKADGTDQTAALQAELDALRSAGGGTLVLPSGTITLNGTITLTNDGATPPKQPVIALQGQGAHWSGRGTTIQGGTVLDIKGADTYGKLKTNGLGLLSISDITFKDSASTTTPFVYTTNTTLHIDQCAFRGAKEDAACDQDAIVLGGINQVEGGAGWTDGFQGYGTVISRNYFDGIRRVVVGQAFSNSVVVRDNTIWYNCGNTAGGAIEWNGKPGTGSGSAAGCVIADNLFEMVNYKYGVVLDYCVGFTLAHNAFWDLGGSTSSLIRLEANALNNRIIGGYTTGTGQHVSDVSGRNTFMETNQSGIYSVEAKSIMFRGGVEVNGLGGIGASAVDVKGNAGYLKAVAAPSDATHPYSRVYICTKPATQVSDGVTTNGSTTITTATGAFVTTDLGKPVGGAGIPNGTFIARVVSSTSVELTQAATATATGVFLYIGRQGAEQEHLGLYKSHLIGRGSAPTIAAGAGAGTGPTVAVAGTDLAGAVTITTGASPATGVLATVTNALSYIGTQRVVLSPANAAAAAVGVWADRGSSAAWTINATVTPPASTALKFNYIAIEGA